ncbi:MAG TPA: D-amino-acid transaminase, partial [Calditerricola sp.]
MRVLYNDQLLSRNEVHIDLEDRAYQFGDGVYEVIRVYDGQLFLLKPHLERLQRSAQAIRIALPWTLPQLADRLQELVAANGLVDGAVYLQVSRGIAPRAHAFPRASQPVLVAYPLPAPRPNEAQERGVRATFVEDIRWLRCDIKSLNLLANVLAKEAAVERGASEAILHRGETVTEGSASNIFIVQGRVLRTHPANHLILDGITRRFVLELAAKEGISTAEAPFTREELLSADEAFFTSTTQEIVPIVEVDGRPIGAGVPGPVTRRL